MKSFLATALAFSALAAWGGPQQPLLLTVGPDMAPWQAAAKARGWLVTPIEAARPDDDTVRAIEKAVDATGSARDPLRTYIAGQGIAASTVFYAVSRRPDLWAAAVAAAGGPAAAIESNRLFGANASLVPILWVVSAEDRAAAEPFRDRLREAGFDIEFRAASTTLDQALDWLVARSRDAVPPKVDCETGSLEFARCYWAAITRFDSAQQNAAVGMSRVRPGSGAMLAAGPFGYRPDNSGPGIEVGWLPPDYSGPLKLQDRILAIAGHPIANAREYQAYMQSLDTERAAAIMIERGKQKMRVETRIVLAKRTENVTARIRAEYFRDARQIYVITRYVGEARLTIPPEWSPCPVNFNGNDAGKAGAGGCWLVTASAVRRCP